MTQWPVVNSVEPLQEYVDLFDFELTDEDLATLDARFVQASVVQIKVECLVEPVAGLIGYRWTVSSAV